MTSHEHGSLGRTGHESGLPARVVRAAALVEAELHGDTTSDPIHSVAAGRHLVALADEALASIVQAARATGVSWQRIGEALGTSRQAAFQRFGSPTDPRTGAPMTRTLVPDATARATAFLDLLAEHHWDEAADQLGPTIREQLGSQGLADAWAQLAALGGSLESTGAPRLVGLADISVVEIPLHLEAADLLARVSYSGPGEVVGLWFLPPEQAMTSSETPGVAR